MIQLIVQNILKRSGEWDIKLKNKNTSDYTRMQVKAFLQLFGVAAYVSLIFIVILVMRGYGLGANSLLYFGIILFLFLSLLLMIFVFQKDL